MASVNEMVFPAFFCGCDDCEAENAELLRVVDGGAGLELEVVFIELHGDSLEAAVALLHAVLVLCHPMLAEL